VQDTDIVSDIWIRSSFEQKRDQRPALILPLQLTASNQEVKSSVPRPGLRIHIETFLQEQRDNIFRIPRHGREMEASVSLLQKSGTHHIKDLLHEHEQAYEDLLRDLEAS
jgi:hypothetical protein